MSKEIALKHIIRFLNLSKVPALKYPTGSLSLPKGIKKAILSAASSRAKRAARKRGGG